MPGIDTYFTNPRALNVEARCRSQPQWAPPRRRGGQPDRAAIVGCIGWALGGLLPERRTS